MGEPRHIYTTPKEFEEKWKGLAAEGLVSRGLFPRPTGEVWTYKRRPDGRYIPNDNYWLIYLDKQGKVERVIATNGYW